MTELGSALSMFSKSSCDPDDVCFKIGTYMTEIIGPSDPRAYISEMNAAKRNKSKACLNAGLLK